ncbi:DUF7344 domain-containing protein [Haladaptatus sp. NG-WS-4]
MEHKEMGALSPTDAFELLKYPYRRRLLMTLLDHNPEDEASIPEDLATNDEELEAMLIEMTHVHLPKLESLDIIEWDRDKNVVIRGSAFEELQPLLKLVDNHRDELPDGWL